MHRWGRRPTKHEDTNGHQDRPQNGGWQPKFGLAAARHTCLELELVDEPVADAVPQRIGHRSCDHAEADPEK